jgi:hypothetical protein
VSAPLSGCLSSSTIERVEFFEAGLVLETMRGALSEILQCECFGFRSIAIEVDTRDLRWDDIMCLEWGRMDFEWS